MATSGRSENTTLMRWPIADLLDKEPYLFEFFQAVSEGPGQRVLEFLGLGG